MPIQHVVLRKLSPLTRAPLCVRTSHALVREKEVSKVLFKEESEGR